MSGSRAQEREISIAQPDRPVLTWAGIILTTADVLDDVWRLGDDPIGHGIRILLRVPVLRVGLGLRHGIRVRAIRIAIASCKLRVVSCELRIMGGCRCPVFLPLARLIWKQCGCDSCDVSCQQATRRFVVYISSSRK